MPVPSNLTAAAAIALTASGTTVQQVDDGATTYDVWYKYTNASAVDEVISVGTWGDLGGGGYRPSVVIWADEAATIFVHNGFVNGSFTISIPAGFTYWFKVGHFTGNYIPSNLNLKFLIGPAEVHVAGNVFIRAASIADWMIDAGLTGLPGAFIDADPGFITGFVPQLITGEAGDVLPTSGRMLFTDDYGSLNGFPPGAASLYVYLFENDFTLIGAPFALDFVAFAAGGLIRTHLPTEKFYIGTNEFNNFNYRTVDENGTLGTLVAVTDFGTAPNAIAVNNAETIMYISHSPSSAGVIKRWDMVNAVFLSNLNTGLADHRITDLLVLPDDTILACYFKTTTTRDCFVRHYDSSGTLLDTFTFTFAATLTSVDPRIGYSADTDAFWILNHLTTGFADVRKIRVSTGAEIHAPSLTPDVLQSSIQQADPPLPHSSDSCPIVELRVSGAPFDHIGVPGPLRWVHETRVIP